MLVHTVIIITSPEKNLIDGDHYLGSVCDGYYSKTNQQN